MIHSDRQTIGWKHLFFDEVDSTNSEALRQARDGADEGLVIVANLQQRGRGRMQRPWHTFADEALAMSILLRPGERIVINKVAQVSLVAAVALCQALRNFAPELVLKWPNDLLFAGKKVAGILTEMQSHHQHVEAVVVGMGINLLPPATGWPHDIIGTATDLSTVSGKTLSKQVILESIEEAFDQLYHNWLTDGFSSIAKQWWHYHGYSGQQVRVHSGGRYISGVAEALNNDGALLLRTRQGLECIISGEVELDFSPVSIT
ncbi:MAG: biotin--[acetyl-CoA-carboxylase] ligase [Mariprofundaceae bacterium]